MRKNNLMANVAFATEASLGLWALCITFLLLSAPLARASTVTATEGYWLVASDGTVEAFGDARPYGSVTTSAAPIVGIEATPDGKGYWLAGSVYPFGNAKFYGSSTAPIVGIEATGEVAPTTPLPAALPLFATGLGALGLLGWRRKRKNAAAVAAA